MQVLLAPLKLVDRNPKLVQGKALNVRYGCRGAWPVLQAPDWQPTEPSPTAAFVIPNAEPFGFSEAVPGGLFGTRGSEHSETVQIEEAAVGHRGTAAVSVAATAMLLQLCLMLQTTMLLRLCLVLQRVLLLRLQHGRSGVQVIVKALQ
jgi:hypothetical protein